MNTVLKIFAVILFVGFIGIQFMRPARTNPHFEKTESLKAITKVPNNVRQILVRSCKDCHSNETVYPWYSNIAPISWSVVDHIRVGRGKLNFSKWGTYIDSRKARKLKKICEEIESGHMPHNQYLWIHWNAELTAANKKTLCDWTTREGAKLSQQEPC